MSTITKEKLRERAREKVKSLEFAVTQTAFADIRTELEEDLELARIALASLEAEPVISHLGSKNALDAIVAFIKSNRNPTLKVYNEVSERLFQDNCHGLSNHVIEYIKQIGEELEELRSTQDTIPPAPVSVPDAMDDQGGVCCEVSYDDGWNACRAAMLHGAGGNSPVVPDGYALVPVEPTAEMQSAAAGVIRFDTTPINKLWTGNAVYKAMIAAAPQQE